MDIKVKFGFAFVGAVGCFLTGFFHGGVSENYGDLMDPMVDHMDSALDLFVDDRFLKMSDLDNLEELVTEAAGWASFKGLTIDMLEKRRERMAVLMNHLDETVEQSRLSLTESHYEPARDILETIIGSVHTTYDKLLAVTPVAAGKSASDPLDVKWSDVTDDDHGDDESLMKVTVGERPFGMHLMRSTRKVSEVFPGFPAHKLGVRPGCEILKIAGHDVDPGTWVKDFQNATMPFELLLNCTHPVAADPGKGPTGSGPTGPLSEDPTRYRVMVSKKPFGMNVQVNVLPRVVEVLAGFPAEGAGVRRGFVLTEVSDQKVNGSTWFRAYQDAPIPFTLTFDTTVPLHVGNPFYAPNTTGVGNETARPELATANESMLPPLPYLEFGDFQCEVVALPFGMGVRAPFGARPIVNNVLNNTPAVKQGVRVGDVLVEVAGRPVDSSTWFAYFQQGTMPFGLRFRRPLNSTA